jgi:hypothetical protein
VESFVFVCEFDVTRRIGWDETEDLASHLDRVVDVLRQNDDIVGIEADANLDSGRASLSVQFESWEPNRNDHARAVLGVAIRAAGGQHVGFLSDLEAAGTNVDKTQWTPLKGPMWRCRRAVVESGDSD